MIYSKLIENIVLPLGDLFFSTNTLNELKKWRKISLLSENELNSLQKENLRQLLEYSVANVPFYFDYLDTKNDDPVKWLKSLPIVSKINYNENIELFLTTKPENLLKKMTSGSSGIQGTIYMNRREQDLNRAIQMLWWEWAGWRAGKPILQTGMTLDRGLLKSLKDFFLRTKYTNAYGLSESESKTVIEYFRGKKNFHIGGYASSMYILAKIAEKNKYDDIKFDAAISWGDKMFPHYRKKIDEIFGCKVFDTYGCSEGLMIGAQCDLDYYYIMTPHIFLEVLDENGNEVPDGSIGKVVVSRLDSRSMPLIRYYTGDLAIKLPKNKYPSKRKYQYPLLEKVIGRDTDIVKTRSGKYLIVHFFTAIFEFQETIKQFRVVQNDLDSIIIEYIPAVGFNKKDLSDIESIITNHLKENFKIIWSEVRKISATASGKPQIIESNIVE